VRQLEDNLKALGYAKNLTVDDKYTSATASAVEKWQEAMGRDETGTIDSSQIVFMSDAVRVSDVKVAVGQQVGGSTQALTVTSPRAIVHVALATAKQNLVKKDDKVQVTMPKGNNIEGTISSVGTVAQTDKDGKSTIDLDITLASTADSGNIDQAPVTVNVASSRASNVLSVPIEALLGLREGGFGVEVAENGTTHIVAVTTGTYGGGRVEITGPGLHEGMDVGVPRS
jgi:peptidoglycan hydrolase-like protein with peptidoglycan-binding domain